MAISTPSAPQLAVIALGLSFAVPVLSAQDSRIPHPEYFRLLGRYEDFAALDSFLATRLAERRPDLGEERRRQMSEFFAYVMTPTGLTAGAAAVLEANGVDIVRAVTADTRPFSEQSLMADLVIVGDVLDGEVADAIDDGYEGSAIVDVRWTLKGHAPADTVVLRLRRGRAGSRRDIQPETGKSYLLLLSSGMYQYRAANHAARNEGWLPSESSPLFYSVYRIYPLIDGRLDWGDFTREETDWAFEDIRRVDHLLSVYSRDFPAVNDR